MHLFRAKGATAAARRVEAGSDHAHGSIIRVCGVPSGRSQAPSRGSTPEVAKVNREVGSRWVISLLAVCALRLARLT